VWFARSSSSLKSPGEIPQGFDGPWYTSFLDHPSGVEPAQMVLKMPLILTTAWFSVQLNIIAKDNI
jgi:hypothetical protein